MSNPPTSKVRALLVAVLLGIGFAATSCEELNDDDDDGGLLSSQNCRLDPADCNGGAGGLCNTDRDCIAPLLCCDDEDNCGGGMCTAECRNDRDCPADMLCEHDLCFYACDDDRDCAPRMSCEHGRTVCEY